MLLKCLFRGLGLLDIRSTSRGSLLHTCFAVERGCHQGLVLCEFLIKARNDFDEDERGVDKTAELAEEFGKRCAEPICLRNLSVEKYKRSSELPRGESCKVLSSRVEHGRRVDQIIFICRQEEVIQEGIHALRGLQLDV